MRYIVSYSGGKDSTALLLLAISKYGRQNIVPVFTDTGAEFPETYEYLDYVEKKLGIKIHQAKSELWDWFSLVRHMGKFYDQKIRRCTSSLKLEPLAKWITANCNRKEDIVLTGERREESPRRSNYSTNYYNKKLRIQGHRPILSWSTKRVFDAIRQGGVEPHPAYKHYARLGCYCCVFNTNNEWMQLYKHYPALFFEVAYLEREINHTVKHGETLPQLISRLLIQEKHIHF